MINTTVFMVIMAAVMVGLSFTEGGNNEAVFIATTIFITGAAICNTLRNMAIQVVLSNDMIEDDEEGEND